MASKKLVTVAYDVDEDYPVFSIRPLSGPPRRDVLGREHVVSVPPELLERFLAAEREWREVQGILRKELGDQGKWGSSR